MSTIATLTPPDHAAQALHLRRFPLSAFFQPRTVALIGATDAAGSVGRALFVNLTAGSFGGRVFPVNPSRSSVLGNPTYASVGAIPDPVGLAVVATPAPTVPGVVRECVQAGVRAAVIISAGFRETGPAGLDLEEQILTEARKGKMRLIGPNCLGIMNLHTSLNATFAGAAARPGSVAFISQSGASMHFDTRLELA